MKIFAAAMLAFALLVGASSVSATRRTTDNDGDAYSISEREQGEKPPRKANGSSRASSRPAAVIRREATVVRRDYVYVCDFDTFCDAEAMDSRRVYLVSAPPKPESAKPTPRRKIFLQDLFAQKKVKPPSPAIRGREYAIAGHRIGLYAVAAPHRDQFYLLGDAVQVKIYPVRYEWDYGDGVSSKVYRAGTSEEDTDSRHVYKRPGQYTVKLRVFYAGEVNWGAGWQSAPGQISLPAADHQVEVFKWKLRLFADNCYRNPAGTGCG